MASALLVHGAGGGGWEWAIWRGVLEANGVAVAAPDLQPVSEGIVATRLHDYVAQMAQELSRLPRPRAAIGASLGGLVAMHLAPAADALVLVNPLPPSPWHADLPSRAWPDAVPWHRDARLASTRQALADADDASALSAFRRWREESGAVMREAWAGVAVERPSVPVFCIASGRDEDVPPRATRAIADAWDAHLLELHDAGHVGPLLGRSAAKVAGNVAAWLSAR